MVSIFWRFFCFFFYFLPTFGLCKKKIIQFPCPVWQLIVHLNSITSFRRGLLSNKPLTVKLCVLWCSAAMVNRHHFSKLFSILSPKMPFVVVIQSLSCVWLFATPRTVAFQSFTVSWSLLRFMSIESVMLSNHLHIRHLPTWGPHLPVLPFHTVHGVLQLRILE